MKRVHRPSRTATILSTVGLACGSIVALSGASMAPSGVQHLITCKYTPDQPYQYGSGAPINAEADIVCSPEGPDVSSTTIRIWRYDSARAQYYLVAEKTSNKTGSAWTLGVTGACTAKVAYKMHTQVINDSFHGSWGHTEKNSTAVTRYC